MIHEYTCKCNACGQMFSYTDEDLKNNKRNAMDNFNTTMRGVTASDSVSGSIYLTSNRQQIVDYNKCPYCGSVRITKNDAYYRQNQDGNYEEVTSESDINSYNLKSSIPTFTDVVRSIVTGLYLIGILLVLFAVFSILRIFI